MNSSSLILNLIFFVSLKCSNVKVVEGTLLLGPDGRILYHEIFPTQSIKLPEANPSTRLKTTRIEEPKLQGILDGSIEYPNKKEPVVTDSKTVENIIDIIIDDENKYTANIPRNFPVEDLTFALKLAMRDEDNVRLLLLAIAYSFHSTNFLNDFGSEANDKSYKGRGLIKITTWDNYKRCNDALKKYDISDKIVDYTVKDGLLASKTFESMAVSLCVFIDLFKAGTSKSSPKFTLNEMIKIMKPKGHDKDIEKVTDDIAEIYDGLVDILYENGFVKL